MCAVLYRILGEVLTEKIIFEHRTEGRETEKSSRNLNIFQAEKTTRKTVQGMVGMSGEQKESMCGWVHRSIDREEWGKVKSEE